MNDSNKRRVASVNVPPRPSPWRGVIAFAGAAAIGGIAFVAVILAVRGEPQAAAPDVTSSPVPTSTTASIATTGPSASGAAVATGSISGLLSYPSDFIPAMKVFAVSTTDSAKWYRVDTPQSPVGATYTLTNVPAGSYRLYAYTSTTTQANWNGVGGSYTEYVQCGLQPPCSDHTVVAIIVISGQTTRGVDLADWYAPNTFPAPPE
jgi:hypothetical protein